MKQNQKRTTPLNPHLANLIGEFVLSEQDKTRLHKAWEFVAGTTKRRLVSSTLTGVLVFAGLVTYIAYGTTFNVSKVSAAQMGISTSQSDTELRAQLRGNSEQYEFSVQYPDNSIKTFKLADAGIAVNDKASTEQIRQSVRHLGWKRFAWWQSTDVPLVIIKDTKKYDAFLAKNVAIANKPATDASVSVQAGKAVITEGVEGSTYQITGSNKQLINAARSLKPLKAKLEPAASKPAITAADLKKSADTINEITGHSVSFQLGERTIIVSPTDIGNWLDIQAVPEQKTADVTVNSGKVQAYIDKLTASSIYPSKAQVSTTAADGTVTVLAAGRKGSAIANKTTVARNVTNQLQQRGSVITAKFEVTEDPFKTINAGDYDKWLVADVKTKRMYAYERNKLVRTFLISAGAPKTPTVLGTYKVYHKTPLRTMRGANADGSRYVQPDVKYVLYFYKDYAVHGNYWRPTSYFGNINSSHGCIGITDSDAEWIYNWAPIGTTVITHD